MSEEKVKKIRELIDKGIGDLERLHRILNTFQNGEPIEPTDQSYIESLSQEASKFDQNSISVDTSPPKPIEADADVSRDGEVLKEPRGYKKKVILGIIIVVAILCSYIGADVYAANTLQIKPHQGSQYIMSETMLHIQAEACNPSFFPVSFHNYTINAIYKSKVLETVSINGSTISPKSSLLLDGIFTINKEALSQFVNLGSSFDPTQARVKTKLDAAIFGMIPFTINKDYSGKEFQDIVKNGPPGGYSC